MGLQRNYLEFLAPGADVAPAASTEVIPANTQRGYLIIINQEPQRVIWLGIGQDAVEGAGIGIPPNGSYEMVKGQNLSSEAIFMVSSANADVSWQEANLQPSYI